MPSWNESAEAWSTKLDFKNIQARLFCCPSSSIPTGVIDSFSHSWFWIQLHNLDQTIPYLPEYLTNLANLLSWPTWTTLPPDILTHLTYPPICPTHPPDFKLTHPDNLPEPTCSIRISTKLYKAIPIHTESDQISQFWQNFMMFTKFDNFDQISQFWLNFTILTNFYNCGKSSQFPWFFSSKWWPNFTVLTKFQLQVNTYNANNAD